ncbi:M24 family metallopeptidase [Halopenitus sp. POP-27]|uniref:M24 family metallopeptidase n=1 Tax=Halopenitus sp. POP-27 TaxID=2994425 RepID=UPI0024691DBA|nr:M24 family metallopeptidase [Halopenitus sp. POP-27]
MVDRSARTARLDDYLAAHDLDAVWFVRPNGFAWLLGGSNVVDRGAPVGAAAAGYDGEFRVIASADAADRIREEEVPDDVPVESVPWHEGSLPAAIADRSPMPAALDVDATGFEDVDASRLRQPLTDDDVDRYRELGREAAAAVETVCRQLEPTDPEYEVAAAIEIALAARDVSTPVLLVGGDDRASRFRSPTPGDAELGEYAIVSVTAERGGLHASLTRTVVFDPPAWLRDRHRAAARIEATAIAATEVAVGRSEAAVDDSEAAVDGSAVTAGDSNRITDAGDVFTAIRDAYDAVGHPDEWRAHHQGGAAGFDVREWIARPEATDPVTAPMGYAWNPTVAGARSEDTHLVAGDRTEIITKTGRWPTLEVESVDVDGVRQRQYDRHAPVVLSGE